MSDDFKNTIGEGITKLVPQQLALLATRAEELKLDVGDKEFERMKTVILSAEGGIRSELLFRVGDDLIDNGENEIALTVLEEAIKDSKGSKHELFLHNSFGLALYLNGRLNEAIEILTKLLQKKIGNELRCTIQHYLGLSYFDSGDYKSAASNLKEAAKEYDEEKMYELSAQAKEDEGRVYHETGEYEKALKIFGKANDYAKEKTLEKSLERISALRGYALMELGRLRPAADALEFSLGDKSNPVDTIDRMKFLAQIYMLLGSSEKAEVAYKELNKLAEMVGDKEEMINALDLLGVYYQSVDKYSQAKETLRQSFNLRVKFQEETGIEFPGSWEFCQLFEKVNKMAEYIDADYSDKLGIKPHPAYDLDEKITISMKRLIELLDKGIDEPSAYALKYSGKNLKDATNDFQKEYILQILKMYEWDKAPTSKHLGVSTSNLYHYLYKLDIER